MTQSGVEHRYLEPGEAIAERLHEIITAAKSKYGDALARVTVVTPGFYSNFYLRRWIANRGLLNVEFTRVEDLAELLAQPAIIAHDGKSLTRLKGAELVRAAVAESGSGGVFAGLESNPSFLGALQRTLRELEAEQRDESPVSFDKLPAPSAVTRAVGEIWETYQRLKSGHRLFDRTQVAGWASNAVRSGVLETPWAQLAIGRLVVLAVATPATQYSSLWQALVKLPAATVVVGVTGDERSDAALSKALEMEIPGAVSITSETPVTETVSAADTRSEVAALIQRIVAAAERGVPFNRIAVYYNNSSYASRVRTALEMAGIPVSGQPPETLLATPVGRFANSLLEIASSDLARQTVGDWLATSAVKDPSNGTAITGTEWDRISRAARVSRGIERWNSRLERYAKSRLFRAEQIEQHGDDDDSAGPRKAEAFREEARQSKQLLGFISTLGDDLKHPDSRTWTEWADWLSGLLKRYLDNTEGSASAESAERVSTLLDRIGELDLLRSPRPDLNRFAAVVVRELTETRAGAQKLGRGVFVAIVRDAAATQFEHVHILGMADGAFPSPDTTDPLLPDHVREQLNASCGISLPLSGVRLALRRREFMTALQSGKHATLYWSRSSGPGTNDAGPAQWLVEQVRRRPDAVSVQAGELLRRPESVPGLSVVEYATGDAASDIHEYEIASVKRHVETQKRDVRHLLEDDRGSGVPAALELERGRFGARPFPRLSKWSGDLSSVAGVLPSISGEVLSASRVESFAGCPLRYFFGYVLAVDAPVRDQDDFHMLPDRKGTFIHGVLELYLNLRLNYGKSPGEKTLDEATRAAMANWLAREPDVAGRVWEIETGEIRRQLRRWLAAERALAAKGFQPSDAELSFGRGAQSTGEPGGSGLPPLEIALADGTALRFSGVIDRVERRDDGSHYVLDYKTGSPRSYSGIGDDPVDRGKHLQLALYSKAIEQFRPADARPIAGYWFVLDSKQRFLPDAETFDPDTASEGLANVLEVLHASNSSGQFPPNPGDRAYAGGKSTFSNCTYCDFDRVCPASSLRERMLNGHSKEPRLATYFDLALDRSDEQARSAP